MTDSSTNTFYNVDRPIENSSEDSLDRRVFAENLAKAIGYWDGSESLVIGLYGEWGSGKTSIKNMVVESIKSQDNKTVVPIEFNPWYWSGQKELIEAFFREIGYGLDNKELSRKWNLYGHLLSYGSGILKSAASISLSTAPQFTPFFSICSFAMGKVGKTITEGAELLKLEKESKKKSLEEIKEDIHTKLSENGEKYLIIIDDIDRLPPDQIRMMFQLIKANADFPKFVYLLMFQKDIVEKALEIPGENINGQSYLNKIIQIPFDVPMANTAIIHEYLENNIKNIFDKHGISSELTPEGLEDAMWLIGPLFNNYRDVKRFLNTLRLNIPLLIDKNNFLMVAPVDYIIIEALRIISPEVYRWIVDTETDGVKFRNMMNNTIPTDEKYKQMSIIQKGLLRYLFSEGKIIITGKNDKAITVYKTDKRSIFHSKNFDLYFSLYIEE